MKNHNLHRIGTVLALIALLTCLLTVSAFAGEYAEWGYQQLDEQQKLLYEELCKIVSQKEIKGEGEELWLNQIETPLTLDDEAVYETLRMLVADHPEYYWFDGQVGLGAYGSGAIAYMANFQYAHVDENEAAAFEDAVEKMLANCPEDGSDYEKSLYLHDALAEHIVYDLEYLEEQTAFSAIVNGRAVCAGFARAYQYLLNQVGIDAWTVEGFGVNPQTGSLEDHAWTLLWIEGKCVYTDVTWDNQDDDPNNSGRKMYAYFNRSYEEISKDHVTDPDGFEEAEENEWIDYFGDKLPQNCGHEENSYFAVNNINKIPYMSIETLATNVKGNGESCMIHVLYDDLDYEEVKNWFEADDLANMYKLVDAAGIDKYKVTSFGYACLGAELCITIEMGSYQPPTPEMMGYIYEVTAKGELTAYVNYATSGLDLDAEYENVMVACYGEEDELLSVDIITLELDQDGHGTVKADCPDDFSYCRVFVVGSDENPSPLCDLLELAMPQSFPY